MHLILIPCPLLDIMSFTRKSPKAISKVFVDDDINDVIDKRSTKSKKNCKSHIEIPQIEILWN